MGERAHSCLCGLCPLHPASPWPGPSMGGWWVPARWGGARARTVIVPNGNLAPFRSPALAFLTATLCSSEEPGGKPVAVGKWAGAHSSLGQRKWLAGSRPVGRNCVDDFSGPGKGL